MPPTSRKTSPFFVNTSNGFRFTISHHGEVRLNKTWRETGKVSSYNVLYLVYQGRGQVRVNGRFISLEKGYAYLFPLGSRLDIGCDNFLEKFFIHFNLRAGDFFDLFELFPMKLFARPLNPTDLAVIKTFAAEDIKNALLVRNKLLEIIAGFVSNISSSAKKRLAISRKYQPLMQFIDSHLGVDLSLSVLAKQMNLSAAYLAASFKQDIGKTLMRMITHRLVERARAELVESPKKVMRIAQDLKFHDELYFSKWFRRETGYSPSDYRALFSSEEPRFKSTFSL